jgi:hypothetical protein
MQKIALGALSCAARVCFHFLSPSVTQRSFVQIILVQRDRDDAIRELLRKLGEVCSFTQVGKISSMHPTLRKISQQTCECANYTDSIWSSSFLLDGTRVITGSQDKTVWL